MSKIGKLGFKSVVLTVTLFVAIASIICGFFYVFLPQQTAAFGNYLFHGMSMQAKPITFAGFIIGFVEAVLLAVIGSALFVWLYNKIAKE